jgi:hypothetical protein
MLTRQEGYCGRDGARPGFENRPAAATFALHESSRHLHSARRAAAELRPRHHLAAGLFAAGLVCAHWRDFTFETLRLIDDMVMIHIPRHRRFVCTQCGSRKVTIRSVWPERKAMAPFYSRAMS